MMSTPLPVTPKIKDKAAARWLLAQARPAGRWIILSTALGAAGGLLVIAQAGLIAHLVHAVCFADRSPETLTSPLVYLILCIGLRALIAWMRERASFEAGARIRIRLRKQLAGHLFNLGPLQMARHRSGALATTLIEHIEALQPFYSAYLPQMGLAVLVPVAIVIAVMPISWAAGMVMLLTAPMIPLFMMLVGMGVETISQRHFESLARMSAYFLDLLKGLATLKLFGRSRVEQTRIESVSDQYRRRTLAVLRVAFLSSAVLEFFSAFAIALLAVYLGMRYLGYVEFGTYGRLLSFQGGFFILLVAPEFYLPFRELGTHFHARADAIGAAREILKILDRQPPAIHRPTAVKASPNLDKISMDLQGIQVQYGDRSVAALNELTLTIDAGDRIAIVGDSGAGKTTLINLLLGFVPADRGSIKINGIDLRTLDLNHWRQHIAWIDQAPTLFHGSLRDNIHLSDPQATEAALQTAIRQAGVDQFCHNLPGGLDYPIGEMGAGLSKGQIQRVALARAFLKKAPLLVLDEPTAGLDPQTETQLLQALQPLAHGRTLILTSHREAPLMLANRLVVLQKGRVVAQGACQKLLSGGRSLERLIKNDLEGGP